TWATPPPRAVELTFQTTLPLSNLRASSIASSTCFQPSPSSDSKRSGESALTWTSVSAAILVTLVCLVVLQLLPEAIGSAIYPTLLAVVILILAHPNPRPLLPPYLAP